MDEVWAKSVAARNADPSHTRCIFTLDKSRAAAMINGHMRWRTEDGADNLVSWTSSVLYALISVFYRRAFYNEGMDNIFLCIIDTDQFPANTFISGSDLVDAFKVHSEDLRSFDNYQYTRPPGKQGWYYFGEYLSQGALRIQDNCKPVSVQQMLNCGLLELHPRFPEFRNWSPGKWPLAKLVVELREPFYGPSPAESEDTPGNVINACVQIGRLFGSEFEVIVAMSLFSLVPNRDSPLDIVLEYGASDGFGTGKPSLFFKSHSSEYFQERNHENSD